MEKENVLSLLKEYFELDETINELSDKLDVFFEKGRYCKDYIIVEKKDTFGWGNVTNSIEASLHKARKNALLKYADEIALQKYMEEEGYKYEKKSLEDINAKTFIICDIIKRSIHDMVNELKFSPLYKRRFNMFEFDTINNKFFIAYD
jgi:hypothetical protein